MVALRTMFSKAAAAALVAVFAVQAGIVPADAHGPTRQKVVKKIEINAPADKVWAVVGNFQDLNWHPAVAKTEGEGGNDKGAKRTLTLEGGGVIHEQLILSDPEKMMVKYEITDVDVKVLPVNNYSSRITVKANGDTTTVIWWGAFYRGFMNNDPPPELNEEAAVKAVTGIYTTGLEALKKKLEGGS